MSPEEKDLQLGSVITDELEQIAKRRHAHTLGEAPAKCEEPALSGKAACEKAGKQALMGLAFSGGGIRSATINLGEARSRDRSKKGYERYVALGILGRNLQTLGKLLLAKDKADCQAAKSKRKRTAG